MPATSSFGSRADGLISAGARWAVERAVVGMDVETAEGSPTDLKAPAFVAGNSVLGITGPGSGVPSTCAPHFVQNFVCAVRGEPHLVQSRRAPHLVQNAFVSSIEAPHFSHTALTSLLISLPWPLRSEVSQSSCRHSRAAQNQG